MLASSWTIKNCVQVQFSLKLLEKSLHSTWFKRICSLHCRNAIDSTEVKPTFFSGISWISSKFQYSNQIDLKHWKGVSKNDEWLCSLGIVSIRFSYTSNRKSKFPFFQWVFNEDSTTMPTFKCNRSSTWTWEFNKIECSTKKPQSKFDNVLYSLLNHGIIFNVHN